MDNITIIIIVLLVVFIASLVLLNLKKIKAFFAKFKKSKKKKSSKGKGKKDKDSKGGKLQKSVTQTRPIVKPPEQKKPEDKKEEGNKEQVQNSENSNKEYQQTVKPIIASTVTPPNSYANNANGVSNSNAFSGSRFNKVPVSTREELDKEFDEIRRFINSSPVNAPTRQNPRPSFFGATAPNSQSGRQQQASSYLPNRQNPFGVSNQNKYIQNSPSTFNPFMQSGLPSNQNSGFKNNMAPNIAPGFNSANKNFEKPQSVSANTTPNTMLNSAKFNPFTKNVSSLNGNTINLNANENLLNLNQKTPKSNSFSNFYNPLNFDKSNEIGTAKIKIDDDEIDLNKLPPNVKNLIISNILARKNFDD